MAKRFRGGQFRAVARRRIPDWYIENVIRNVHRDDDDIPLTRAHGLSLAILAWYFGTEWVLANLDIKKMHPNNFLRRHVTTMPPIEEPLTHMLRVVDLAETVLNLRDADGIDVVLDQLETGHIESAFSELEVGKFLTFHNIKFRFVAPCGTIGDDYDIELTFPEGMTACSDTKCKIETTKFSNGAIRNVLAKARKQLPPDRPGVIFVKVPQTWFIQGFAGVDTFLQPYPFGGFAETFGEIATEFFRKTKRIVCIQFYSTVFRVISGTVATDMGGIEVTNLAHRFEKGKYWGLFHQDKPTSGGGKPPTWIDLQSFFGGERAASTWSVPAWRYDR